MSGPSVKLALNAPMTKMLALAPPKASPTSNRAMAWNAMVERNS